MPTPKLFQEPTIPQNTAEDYCRRLEHELQRDVGVGKASGIIKKYNKEAEEVGMTPLHYFASVKDPRKYRDIIPIFLYPDVESALDKKNKFGETVIEMARKNQTDDELLEVCGGQMGRTPNKQFGG